MAHIFDIVTCGEYEIAHLDGNEVSDFESYSVERRKDGSSILTLRLPLNDLRISTSSECGCQPRDNSR